MVDMSVVVQAATPRSPEVRAGPPADVHPLPSGAELLKFTPKEAARAEEAQVRKASAREVVFMGRGIR